MAVKQVKDVANIPTSELDDWGPVPEPVSEQVSHLRGLVINENEDEPIADMTKCEKIKYLTMQVIALLKSDLKYSLCSSPG